MFEMLDLVLIVVAGIIILYFVSLFLQTLLDAAIKILTCAAIVVPIAAAIYYFINIYIP